MSDKQNPTEPHLADKPEENAELPVDIKLNLETGVIGWDELVRHFARGVVIKVELGRDLIEVAECLSKDDTEQLKQWLDDLSVARASDDDARDWTLRVPQFWCVVTAPWVLVQEKSAQTTVH